MTGLQTQLVTARKENEQLRATIQKLEQCLRSANAMNDQLMLELRRAEDALKQRRAG